MRLELDAFLAIKWFKINRMKLSKEKRHLSVSGHKCENVWVKMGNENIWESKKQNYLQSK